MKELSEADGFIFHCMSPLPPPPPPSPSHSPVRTVMDARASEKEKDCWVVVTCVKEEEEEEEKGRQSRTRQRPCCSEEEEHYLLSLLSSCDCLSSEWARRTLTSMEVSRGHPVCLVVRWSGNYKRETLPYSN